MRSLYSGVSGLRNHQTKMDVIGDNIANVNTIGFKKSRVNFQDMLTQTIKGASAPQSGRGGVNAMQVGLGMGLGSIDVVNTQGNLQNTGKTTDLAIDGDGFIILRNGNDEFYTRTGTLDIDKSGDLIMSSNGLKVAGWLSDADGLINTASPINTINIPVGVSVPAQATGKAMYGKNLAASQSEPINTSITTYDSLGDAHAINMTYFRPTAEVNINDVVFDTTDASVHDFKFNIYDNTGNKHEITVTMKEDGDKWYASAVSASPALAGLAIDNASPHDVATAGDRNSLKTGGLKLNYTGGSFDVKFPYIGAGVGSTFDSGKAPEVFSTPGTWKWKVSSNDPKIDSVTAPTTDTITFDSKGNFISGGSNIVVNYKTTYGLPPQTINVDMSHLTQYDGDTTVVGVQDGYTTGTLQSISVDNSGIVTGAFSNGLTKSLAQVALATFQNPAGLAKSGGSLYKVSNNSGDAQIGTSGNGGRGMIKPGSLEMANVDLAQEFTDMITTQRGFQANSKIISTTDQMLEELVNLKR